MRIRLAAAKRSFFCGLATIGLLVFLGAMALPALGQDAAPVMGNGVDGAFEPVMYDGNVAWGDLLFRFQYHTRGYGEEAGLGSLGINKTWLFDRLVFFGDMSCRIDDDQLRPPTPSAGCGIRILHDGWFNKERARIFGANFWYDGTHIDSVNAAENYCYFQQFGVGLESLGEKWDLRANAYLPISSTTFAGPQVLVGTIFEEHYLVAGYTQQMRYAVTSVEGEIARRLGDRNLWAFASCYGLDGGGETAVGGRAGLRGYVAQDVLASLSVANDEMFNTTVMFQITWFMDWGARGRAAMAPECIIDRLREPVQRNDYVAVLSRQESGSTPVTSDGETPIYFVHADSNAAGGGDGTYENPYNTLALAENNSSVGNYLFLHNDSVFTGGSITLKNSQSMLGEGASGGHYVSGYLFGELSAFLLPDRGGAVPEILNAPGTSAVLLASGNTVSGLVIDGAQNAITAPSGTGGSTTIDRITASNLTGYGLDVDTSDGTLTVDQFVYSGGTTGAGGMRFSTFTGVATVSDSTLTGGTGTGVDVQGGTGSLVFSNVGIASTGGVAYNIAGGTSSTTFSGTITNPTGGAVAIDGGAPTVAMNAAIQNNAGRAVQIENLTGGNITFGGSITDTAEGLLVQNNTGGSVTFGGTMSLTTGANDAVTLTANTGTAIAFNGSSMAITTTTGQGFVASGGGTISGTGTGNSITSGAATAALSLSDVVIGADGLNFQSVSADGAANGIALTNLSGGSLTIAGGTITNSTDKAVLVDGGTPIAAINTAILDNDNGSIEVTGITGGNVAFGGSVSDSAQGLLVQNSTGGTVTFGGSMTLNTGTNSAVTFSGNSGATIDFNSLVAGTLTSGYGFLVENNTGGLITIGGTVTESGGGLLVQNNTGGTVTFDGDMTLNSGTNTAMSFDTNAGTWIAFEGSQVDITTTTGEGFVATGGGTLTCSNSTNTITTGATSGSALRLSDVVIDSGNGLTFSSIVTDGAANGISMTNVTGGTAGYVTVSGGTISGGTGTAVLVDGGTPLLNMGAVIDNSAGRSVIVQNTSGTASVLLFNASITDSGEGILVDSNSGGLVQFLGQMTLNTGTNTAVTLTDNTDVNIYFTPTADTDGLNITTTSGTGFLASNGGTITLTGNSNTITTTTGTGLSLDGITVGAAKMNFQSVTVDGAANGIVLNNISGSTIAIGNGGSAAGSGGTLSTSGTAISATNVANLSLNYMDVSSTGGSALALNATSGTTTTLFDHNTFANNSAASITANIQTTSSGTLNATWTNNSFTNSNAGGTAYEALCNGAAAEMHMYLTGNTATGGTADYNMTLTSGTFGLHPSVSDTSTNNTGTVTTSGAISDDSSAPAKPQ